MSITVKHYHQNETRYVPVWAKTALVDLETFLNDSHLVSKYNIEETMLWNSKKSSKFVIVQFSELSTITDTEMKELNDLGWSFYWFQDFGEGNYTFELKFKKVD